ncbi:hypothetical protein DSL92_06180 [Billgrantia gudaonensis]|uniref:Uncharacterized protein n=1 Tax=Billgrantia gudaonensis TaxID=376427 RepID=A0A432JIQ9_9GAMM|nr:hypothetical protein DSL92_06180 [Halomonas gudaonensis]
MRGDRQSLPPGGAGGWRDAAGGATMRCCAVGRCCSPAAAGAALSGRVPICTISEMVAVKELAATYRRQLKPIYFLVHARAQRVIALPGQRRDSVKGPWEGRFKEPSAARQAILCTPWPMWTITSPAPAWRDLPESSDFTSGIALAGRAASSNWNSA